MLNRQFKTKLFASLFALAALSISFTACNNAGNDHADDADYTAYRSYVTSVRDTSDRYYDKDWAELERDYNERKARVEAKMDKMDEKSRAEYNQLESDWNGFKTRYDERRAQQTTVNTNNDRYTVIRTTFVFPDPADYRYANLSATSVAESYKRFFDGFKGEGANYTKEDWQEIDEIYKALEERRDALKNEIPPKDADMISTIKKQYASIMATNRPFAEDQKNQ